MLRVAIVVAALLMLLAGGVSVPSPALAASRADVVAPAAPQSGVGTGGTITGTVAGFGGAPIENASVIAQGYEGCCAFFNGTTNELGQYSIAVDPGTYRVGAGAPTFVVEYYDGTYSYAGATPVSVGEGATASGINIALDVGGSISGVVRAGGVPVAGALVEVEGCCDYASATTDANGAYNIDALAPGAYSVQASRPGLAPRYYNGVYDRDDATEVVIAGEAVVTGIDVALTPGGSVFGIVTDHLGTALVGAEVAFFSDQHCCAFATTTAGGAYQAFGLPPGAYTMQVRANGYPLQYFTATFDSDAARPIIVEEAAPTPDINMQLILGGSISGAVTDGSGAPIAGARVEADTVQCCGFGGSTLTDAGGLFTISAVAPGDYQVTASAAGFAPEYFNNVIDIDSAAVIAVGQGTTRVDVSFALGAGATISGTVIGAGGLPVAGAFVFASADSCCLSRSGANTDANGQYSITDLNPGVYRVSAFATSYVTEYYNGATSSDTAAPVFALAGVPATGIDFSLDLGGTISGVVLDGTGAPIGGATVVAFGVECCAFGSASAASDGTYTIRGLSAGNYIVRADAGGFVDEYYDDAAPGEDTQPVAVVLGANTPNIDFSLDLGGSISGRIEDANGNPIAGAEVSAFLAAACCGSGFDETTSNGTYTIRGLPAGSYIVGTNAGGFVGEYYNGVTDLAAATPVAVTLGTLTPSINFTLDTGGSISGTVRDASNNSPLAFASVLAIGDDCCLIGFAETNANGQYTIDGLATGAYTVRAEQFEFDDQYYDHARNEADATPVNVTKDINMPNINFDLLPPTPDDFFSMRRIPALPYTDTFNTAGAGLDSGEPQPCGDIGATIWYIFELPASASTPRSLTVDTAGSTFATVLALYTGTLSPPEGITSLACNDGAFPAVSTLTFTAQPGQAYLIQLGGAGGATGNATLNLYCTGDPQCATGPTATVTPTVAATPDTPTPTPTLPAAPSATSTAPAPSPTPTSQAPDPTVTPIVDDGATATAQAVASATPPAGVTNTPVSTATMTPVEGETPTNEPSATATPEATQTSQTAGTPAADTATATPVFTATPTTQPSASATHSPTASASATAIAGGTRTPTATATAPRTATVTKTRVRESDTRTPASSQTSAVASPVPSTTGGGGGAGGGASNPQATPPISSVLGSNRGPVALPDTGGGPDDRNRNAVVLTATAIAGLLGGAVLLSARRSRSR